MRQLLLALVAMAAGIWSSAVMAAPSLEAYGKLPGFERAELSPSGDRYAVVGVVGAERRLLVLSGGQVLANVKVGEQKVRNLRWAGEEKLLVFVTNTYSLGPNFNVAQYEIAHAIVIDIPNKAVKPLLTDGPAGNGVWGTYGVVPEGGRWYGYFGGITLARSKDGSYYWQDGHPDLYKVDLETGRHSLAARGADGEGGRREWLLGPAGEVLATFDFNVKTGSWKLKAGKSGDAVASGSHPYGGVGPVSQGRTLGTVVFVLPDEDETPHWVEAPLSGGDGVELLPEERVLAPIEDSRTGLLIGYWRAAETPEPVFFDAARQAKVRTAQKAFPGLNMSLVSWNEAFDRFIVQTDGVGDSGTWWLVDLRTGKAAIIGNSYPGVREADVGPMKMVPYKAADGLEMEGVLTLPPGKEAKRLPLVVLPHGGPASRDYAEFDWWAQAFASRGYAVFQPNFRGSTGYGQAFEDASRGEWGAKMQTDISDGVAELARQGIVDPKRACIVGASYGGYAALAGVTLQQGLYRCAVSVAGVSDLSSMLNYVRDSWGRISPAVRNWKRDVGEGRELKSISPAKLGERVDAPVLLIHGKDDTVVPFDQSRAMERALKGADKPYEFVVLKEEDHWLSRGETRLQMLQAAVAFVEKHNPAD